MPAADDEARGSLPQAETSAPDAPSRTGLVTVLLTVLLVTLPFIAVRFPPITDLPQQLAQVRLGAEALGGDSAYRFNSLAPGGLVDALFALASAVAPPLVAGRLTYALLGALWVGGLALLLTAEKRDLAALPLAALLFFSHPLYWGFASFLIGAALFCAWIVLERRLRAAAGVAGEATALALGLLLLYLAHAFWCLVAAAWLAVTTLRAELDPRRRALRLATLVPPALAGLAWSAQLAASGFSSATTWWASPLERLTPAALANRVFGGITGPVEPVLFVALLAWIVLAVLAHRGGAAAASDRGLLVVASSCLLAALVLPDRHQNTLQFAGRWAPVGMALLVAGLPTPDIRPALRRAVPLVLLATLSVATVAAWQRFERQELSGLDEALAALPDEPALLGLDFVRLSELVKTQPFFQIPAYGQVLHGGRLGFSFASFPTSPVVFRHWENPPWSPGLEWLPHQILEAPDDLGHFNVVLVHAHPSGHEEFARLGRVEPVTTTGRWQLYRVTERPDPSL